MATATKAQAQVKDAPVAPEQNRGGAQSASEQASEQAGKETRGRKELCKADLGNGATCELPKGHPTDGPNNGHRTIILTAEELTGEFLSDDEIAQVARSAGVPDEKQVMVNQQIDRAWQEWLRRGGKPEDDSDETAPVWIGFKVETAKAQKMRRMLRIAADTHTPPVQLKKGAERMKDGQTMIPVGVTRRRKYEKSDTPK